MSFKGINPDEIINPKDPFSRLNLPKFISAPLLVVIFLIVVVVTGIFYTIEQNEAGVVLRFGKFVRISDPGLHLKIPFKIEKVYPVKVELVYKEEFGFRTREAGIRTSYDQRSYDDESLMLTGDLNVLDVQWIVQYKIKDPVAILFKIRDIRKTLRDISESVMRQITGDYTFNEVLTTKRVEINNLAQNDMQKILDSYDAGIEIVTVKLQDVNPPDTVKPAFNEVNEAKQEREKLINQAWETYNQKIPQAKGEALKLIRDAEGYSLEKINTAQGDAQRFTLLLNAYNKSKEITKTRLYLENMSAVLKNSGKKYIVDADQKSILPLLKLENE